MPRVNARKATQYRVVCDENNNPVSCGQTSDLRGKGVFNTLEEVYAAFPQFEESRTRRLTLGRPLAKLDMDSKVPLSIAHLAKAHQAELALFEDVTDPARLFLLVQEAEDMSMTVLAVAEEIWQLHVECFTAEPERIRAKARIRRNARQ